MTGMEIDRLWIEAEEYRLKGPSGAEGGKRKRWHLKHGTEIVSTHRTHQAAIDAADRIIRDLKRSK